MVDQNNSKETEQKQTTELPPHGTPVWIYPADAKETSFELNIFEVFQTLFKTRWFLLGMTSTFMIIAFVYIILRPTIYISQAAVKANGLDLKTLITQLPFQMKVADSKNLVSGLSTTKSDILDKLEVAKMLEKVVSISIRDGSYYIIQAEWQENPELPIMIVNRYVDEFENFFIEEQTSIAQKIPRQKPVLNTKLERKLEIIQSRYKPYEIQLKEYLKTGKTEGFSSEKKLLLSQYNTLLSFYKSEWSRVEKIKIENELKEFEEYKNISSENISFEIVQRGKTAKKVKQIGNQKSVIILGVSTALGLFLSVFLVLVWSSYKKYQNRVILENT